MMEVKRRRQLNKTVVTELRLCCLPRDPSRPNCPSHRILSLVSWDPGSHVVENAVVVLSAALGYEQSVATNRFRGVHNLVFRT